MSITGLTITATPIGNLADASPRAIASLTAADIIACEDTRHSGRLFQALGIDRQAKLVAYHDHSQQATRDYLITAMKQGKAVTLICDAGTPLISDPGYRLVAQCHTASIPITAIPGPSAALAALVMSGLPTDRFYFVGFLPTTKPKRLATLTEILALAATSIIYESAKRLSKCLTDIAGLAPTRLVFIGRELTKKFEQSWRGEAKTLAEKFASLPPPKGEVVIVVAPSPAQAATQPSEAELRAMLAQAKADGLPPSMAARHVHGITGISKSRLYNLALAGDKGE